MAVVHVWHIAVNRLLTQRERCATKCRDKHLRRLHKCTSKCTSGYCCRASATPLPPASPAPMKTPVFHLQSTLDSFSPVYSDCSVRLNVMQQQKYRTTRLRRTLKNDWNSQSGIWWRVRLYRKLKSQEEGCLDKDLLLMKGGCCQTSWRHGLIFNILHLTVCKKGGCETWQSVFSILCNIISIMAIWHATFYRFAMCRVKDV